MYVVGVGLLLASKNRTRDQIKMKIGMLTGGGDCPGLNAVIRAVVRKGIFHYNDQFIGFLEGWRGVLENVYRPLDLESVAGILPRGGTILRSSPHQSSKERGRTGTLHRKPEAAEH